MKRDWNRPKAYGCAGNRVFMRYMSFIAYCNAWCATVDEEGTYQDSSLKVHQEYAVKAGVVFG
jgi:hypothetical protein